MILIRRITMLERYKTDYRGKEGEEKVLECHP